MSLKPTTQNYCDGDGDYDHYIEDVNQLVRRVDYLLYGCRPNTIIEMIQIIQMIQMIKIIYL